MNYIKGIFRIWLIAAVCWIGYTLFVKRDDVVDTYNYQFRKQQMIEDIKFSKREYLKYVEKEVKRLKTEPKKNSAETGFKSSRDRELEYAISEKGRIEEKARIEKELNSPIIIPEPSREWLLDITILPILLPALMSAVWWILSKIFIWVKKGFVGQN